MTSHTTTDSNAVRAAWEGLADAFDRQTTPRTMDLGEMIVAALDIRPGERVLDVGAGSGAVSIPAARAGASVTAVDIAPTMVDRLRARADAAGVDVTVAVGDGTAMNLRDDVFDVTVSLNGISLFPDLDAGLREAVRVTRPGGRVAIATFGPIAEVEFAGLFLAAMRAAVDDEDAQLPGPLPPFRLAAPGVLATTLEGVGLTAVRVRPLQWEATVDDADDYLRLVRSSNPVVGRLLAGVDDEQLDVVRTVLSSQLRERVRADGSVVLQSRMLLGVGIV